MNIDAIKNYWGIITTVVTVAMAAGALWYAVESLSADLELQREEHRAFITDKIMMYHEQLEERQHMHFESHLKSIQQYTEENRQDVKDIRDDVHRVLRNQRLNDE